ncbi:hypothetical protein ABZW32_37195 [Streptomyces sp. NPDC004667]|uniref:hypothetical protein n=1 Tax=Streptomyces sp. NPDC004667 TaxID=3154285 RepID=UPI0033B5A3A0
MPRYVVGHGTFSGPDTFVPRGAAVSVYANENEKLSIGVAMEIVSQNGNGHEARRVFAASPLTDAVPVAIRNFMLKPLDPHELQMITTAATSKADVHYIGSSATTPRAIRLCEGTPETCREGVHRCEGLLGGELVRGGGELRLVCCLPMEGLQGVANMTTTLPAGASPEGQARIDEASSEARRLLDLLRNPDTRDQAADVLRKLERMRPATAARLMENIALGNELALHDARAMRPTLAGPHAFVNYLAGLSAEQRAYVQEKLEPAVPGPDASATDTFLASFPTDGLDERFRKWKSLTEDARAVLRTESVILADWAREEAAILAFFEECARGHQPRDPVSAVCYERPDLDERRRSEIDESEPLKACREKVRSYFTTASGADKRAAWDAMTERQQALILHVIPDSPSQWHDEQEPVPAASVTSYDAQDHSDSDADGPAPRSVLHLPDMGGQEALGNAVADDVVHALFADGELIFLSDPPPCVPEEYTALVCRVVSMDDGLDRTCTLALDGQQPRPDGLQEAVVAWNSCHDPLIVFE